MKRRLVKSIICGLMLATVLGSAAYAETANYNRYGYNINNIYEVIGGDAGRYLVEGTSTMMKITATSKSTSNKLYKVKVEQRCCNTHAVIDMDAASGVRSQISTSIIASLPRDSKDTFSDYVTNAIAYNSSSEVTGIQDDCTYTIYQRDSE